MNTNEQTRSLYAKGQLHCTKKFQTPTGPEENSFLCGQGRFTDSDFWNLQRRRREFPRKDAGVSTFSI